MNTTVSPSTTQGSALQSYLTLVRHFPVLSPERERDLARAARANDPAAARKLTLLHLRYVVSIAADYRGYGLPMEDLIQEGNIGLLRAVKRFDPDAGVRLMTYAAYWIRSEIHAFVMRNLRLLRAVTTRARRTLFFKLRSFQHNAGGMTAAERREAARVLDVPLNDVEDMDRFFNGGEVSFDRPLGDGGHACADILPGGEADPLDALESEDEAERRRAALGEALGRLDERARGVVAGRFLGESKLTLKTLAERYGVSIERVRQIEQRALSELAGLLAA